VEPVLAFAALQVDFVEIPVRAAVAVDRLEVLGMVVDPM
jgi:hypothetical protein